jgi:hypothetical protein
MMPQILQDKEFRQYAGSSPQIVSTSKYIEMNKSLPEILSQ